MNDVTLANTLYHTEPLKSDTIHELTICQVMEKLL